MHLFGCHLIGLTVDSGYGESKQTMEIIRTEPAGGDRTFVPYDSCNFVLIIDLRCSNLKSFSVLF